MPAQCSPLTVQFSGLGTRIGTYLVCISYLALMLRSKRNPVQNLHLRVYRLAESAWCINVILLVSIFSVGFRHISAVEFLTITHLFVLNASVMAHGRAVGWSEEPPIVTIEHYLMHHAKELGMTASYVARTVLAWWFWVAQYNRMLCASEERTVYAFFFFSKVDAFDWFRVLAILCLVLSLTCLPFCALPADESWWPAQYRQSILVFVYCIVGAELTLAYNNVHAAHDLRAASAPEILALLVGAKALIWAALKPQREADPLVLLVRDPQYRIPLAWPYAGLDLQGLIELWALARTGGRAAASAAATASS